MIKGINVNNAVTNEQLADITARADILLKADASDVYTKTQTDVLLTAKADTSSVYTKSAVDTALSSKANSSDVYSKSAVDTALNGKANTSTTYTKTEVDSALSGKADTSAIPTTIAQLTDDATHRVVTDTEKASWNAKSTFSGDYNDLTGKPTIPDVSGKQDTLVSGTNIKTINGNSILGSGNIAIESGSGLSNEAKTALLNCLANVAWANANGTMLYNNLVSALNPTPVAKTLVSISATYTGGEVTEGTSLDALTGITVTALYDDASTEAVVGYTLSGTIAVGNNTITVTYQSKTTTFTVVGTEAPSGDVVYQVKNQVCDGTQSAFNSDNKYLETENKAFTLAADFVVNHTKTSVCTVAKMMNADSPWPGVAITHANGENSYKVQWMNDYRTLTDLDFTQSTRIRIVMTHEASTNISSVSYKIGDESASSFVLTSGFTKITQPFVIGNSATGTQPFNGTINDVALYSSVFNSEQIASFLA